MAGIDNRIHGLLASIAEYFRDPAGPMLFDVGAHRGSTIDLMREVFPRSTVHAFEPDPQIFTALTERCAGDPTLHAHNVAVGSAPGRLAFNSNRLGTEDRVGSFVPLDPRSGAQTIATQLVDVTTVDGFCQDNGIDNIDYLKIDVQGFEREVLLGAQRMLETQMIRALQVEIIFFPFYARPLSFYDIEALLIPRGYRLFAVENLFTTQDRQLYQLDAFYVGSSFARR